jgi:nitronate monooxygenase
VLTRAFSGRLGRAIANRFLRELRPHEAELPAYPVQSHLTQPIRRAAAQRGLAEYLNLWAGQAAALARPRTAAECVRDLSRRDRARPRPGGGLSGLGGPAAGAGLTGALAGG